MQLKPILNISEYLKSIKIQKNYINKLKIKILRLQTIKEKNYKNFSTVFSAESSCLIREKTTYFIRYVIDVTFSESNIFLHVMDFSGRLILFSSAGLLQHKGKKIQHYIVLKDLIKKLISSCKKHFKNKPVILHLRNPDRWWYLVPKFLKRHFFIRAVRVYNKYPYNGCRKRKVRRKKIRSKSSK